MKSSLRSLIVGFGALAALFVPQFTHAASPGLQLNPLKYEDTLTGTNARNGFIDVSNPTDRSLNIAAQVQGFKQANLDGDLEFFLDDPIKQGIKVGLSEFEIGPRESIRVSFTVDPTKLPKGGVYAAIFFRTIPPEQTSGVSYVAESANVGTLLLLQNGAEAEHIGRITVFDLPFFQFGAGLSGRGEYQNTNRTTAPIAFSPQLESKVLPWGRATKFTGPYVLPGSTRQFNISRTGSFFGFWPVALTDTGSGEGITRWVFICTGVYALIALFLLSLLLVHVVSRLLRRQPLVPETLRALFRRAPEEEEPVQRPLDGLGPRPGPDA